MTATLTALPDHHNPDASTAELVHAAHAHDPLAWKQLITRYSPAIHRVVAGFRFADADAEDAVQATWLSAIENLEALRDPERFGGWLKTIARRECLHAYHRMRRESLLEPTALDVAVECPGPDALLVTAETERAVAVAVSQLPDRARRLISRLYYGPEIDYRGIAETMAMPIGSIGPTRQRALRWLRDQIVFAGFDDATSC